MIKSKLSRLVGMIIGSLVIVSCAKNDEPAASPVVSDVGSFSTQNINGQTTSYNVCADNPNQYCVSQCQAQNALTSCGQQVQTVGQQVIQQVRITRYVFLVPVSAPVVPAATCQNAITYNRAGECTDPNNTWSGPVSNLRVEVPASGVLFVQWKATSAASFYRIVAHGLKDKSSSWVSQEIFGSEVTLDRNTLGGSTNYAGTLYPQALDTLNVPLRDRVPLADNAEYWYELVAYDVNGNVLLGHLDQPLTRPFDVRQSLCSGLIVAGFCELN